MLKQKFVLPFLLLGCLPISASLAFADCAVATGIVFVDANGNHTLDAGESRTRRCQRFEQP